MNGKLENGIAWLRTVIVLWTVLVGLKILTVLGQGNMTSGIDEALFPFIGALVATGIPAFILGWVIGKDEATPPGTGSRSFES